MLAFACQRTEENLITMLYFGENCVVGNSYITTNLYSTYFWPFFRCICDTQVATRRYTVPNGNQEALDP